jgi:hypothetical protein
VSLRCVGLDVVWDLVGERPSFVEHAGSGYGLCAEACDHYLEVKAR